MSKKYNPADIIEQLKQGSNLVALAMDKLIDSPLGDFSPLSVSLDGYWDKGFPELPIQLQAEVSKAYDNDDPQLPEPTGRNGFFDLADPEAQRALRDVCRGMGWDLQSPEQRRRQISEWDSRHYTETSAEEFIWLAEQKIKRRELQGEIEKWEGMATQGIPSEEKIKREMMDKLRAELAEIGGQRLSSRPAATVEQDALVATACTNSKASVEPPGITVGMVTITKLAITAAWEIESEIKREATAKEVIERLKEWVTSKKYAELVEIMPRGVKWVTVRKVKPYDIEACMATLKSWRKRLQQNPA